MKNDIFWSEVGSGFEGPGGTPTKISQEYPLQGEATGKRRRFSLVSKDISEIFCEFVDRCRILL